MLLQWKNHHQSLLLEDKTRATIQRHIEKKVSENEGTWIDWQYLQDAASLLKKVYNTLIKAITILLLFN